MLRPLFFVLVVVLIFMSVQPVQAQGETIQPGNTIERTLTRDQHHIFTITLKEDQFLQVVVEQHGIDVIVRAFTPEGKLLAEVDSPNGTEGPENISIVSSVAGVYRFDVAPLGQVIDVATGRYELKVVELRQATDQEMLAGKNEEILKARGLALISEVVDDFGQIRLPQTRVRAQLQAARLVWPADEKLGAKLTADAIEGVKEFIAGVETSEQDFYQNYSLAMQLRQEVVQLLGPHDPETALRFLQATRSLPNPEGANAQSNQELSMELTLGSQIAAKDPNRTAQLARDTLKRGYSSMLIDLISRLRARNPELASQLAKEVAAKLMNEKLLGKEEAANVAVGLLRIARSPVRNYQISMNDPPPPTKVDSVLLSEQEFGDLFQKALSEALAYTPPVNMYGQERNTAQNILNSLKQMPGEFKSLAPDKAVAIEKKTSELNAPHDGQNALWQKYSEAINNGSMESATEEVQKSPVEMRDQLFQMLAQKAANSGDLPRARQIIKDNVSNLGNQRVFLANIESQAIFNDLSKGKTEEAVRGVSNLKTTRERARMISQVVAQIGPGLKRAQALALLEQARNLVGPSLKVESQEQMSALLEIARAFARYDSKKSFEIIEPLLDQFGEMTNAALVLNGFGQDFFQSGELQLDNGNSVANVANQLIQSLSSLAPANFDRAKADAERIERPEVRIIAYLGLAQQAIGIDNSSSNTSRITYSRGFRD